MHKVRSIFIGLCYKNWMGWLKMQTKVELRTEILSKRSQLMGSVELQELSARVTGRLLESDLFDGATTVAGYLSLGGEFDTKGLMSACFERGKSWLVPAWEAESKSYRASEVLAGDELVEGPFRVLEPKVKRWRNWLEADVVLVPGLAFDMLGNRVGFRRGFYDRILSLCEREAARVAPIFEWQIFEQVPA